MPFFVHMVTNASEMTQYADIVLPATFAPAEKLSIVTNMANLHGHMSIQQPVIKPLWQAKAEETEVMWLLAEKLKAKGFANLYDYYASFEDPETKKKPTNAAEFAEIAAKDLQPEGLGRQREDERRPDLQAGRTSRRRGSTTPRPTPTKRTGARTIPRPRSSKVSSRPKPRSSSSTVKP